MTEVAIFTVATVT